MAPDSRTSGEGLQKEVSLGARAIFKAGLMRWEACGIGQSFYLIKYGLMDPAG